MSVDKIPTAEEWLSSRRMTISTYEEDMIEFTKLHVQEFAKQIQEKGYDKMSEYGYDWWLSLNAIYEIYPLENIK